MPPNQQYPFAAGPYSSASSSSSHDSHGPGLPAGPNAQRRYYPEASAPPSTTNLIPNQRTSAGSFESLQSNNSGAVHANFARGPSLSSKSGRSINESPYSVSAGHGSRVPSVAPSISDKFSLSPDPAAWGADISPNHPEPDDFLHNPDPKRDLKNDGQRNIFTLRGLANLGCILILGVGMITLFAGYPLISHFTAHPLSFFGGFNVGGINATGQVPEISGNFGLVDLHTPKDAYTIDSYHSPGTQLQLVF